MFSFQDIKLELKFDDFLLSYQFLICPLQDRHLIQNYENNIHFENKILEKTREHCKLLL